MPANTAIAQEGPITEEYRADPQQVCERLNQLRSTELVSYLQYKQHAYMAVSLMGPGVVDEFVEHSNEELQHADKLAKRIQALGGVPVFDPQEIAREISGLQVKPAQGSTLEEMVKEDLDLERTQVRVYTAFIRQIGDKDIVTRRLLEDILEATEDHAAEMWDLLQQRAETAGDGARSRGGGSRG